MDVGNATVHGLFPKTASQEAWLNNVYGSRMRSFCQEGDAFCASGTRPRNLTIHLEEVQTYADQALAFLLPLVKETLGGW